VSNHVKYWGLVSRHYYPRKLLAVVLYQGGERSRRVVDLPDLRKCAAQVVVTVEPPSP
jgi:hypothetical protein